MGWRRLPRSVYKFHAVLHVPLSLIVFRCTESSPCYQGRDTGKSLQCRSTNMGERIQCGWFTYLWKKISYLLSSGVLIILELMISTYSFSRIFHVTRSQQIPVPGELTGKKKGTSSNMMRYEKTVINALWVQLILAVGYRPFTVVTVVILILGLTSTPFLAEELALCLLYVKFFLNPVLYCWKIKRNRRSVKKL